MRREPRETDDTHDGKENRTRSKVSTLFLSSHAPLPEPSRLPKHTRYFSPRCPKNRPFRSLGLIPEDLQSPMPAPPFRSLKRTHLSIPEAPE